VFIGVKTILPALAVIVALSRERNADVLCITSEMFSGITFVALSAFIVSRSIDNNAEVRDACEVLIILKTISICRAFVFPSAIHGDAGVALTDVVLLAVVIGDTFIVGISWNNNAGNTGTCEVLTFGKTIRSSLTFILHIAIYRYTDIVFTCQMLSWINTITIDHACIRSITINNSAGFIDTFKVFAGFETVAAVPAFASAEPGKFNARIAIANGMRTSWNTFPAGKLVATRDITIGILNRIFSGCRLAPPIDALR
jgi:hypothetical protein